MQLRTVNIRALKDKLSAYLRDVQRGDVLLVTDRGKVVAELRKPTLQAPATDAVSQLEQGLVERGEIRPGLPNRADAYRRPGLRLEDAVIDDALAWNRGDR